MLLHHQNRQLNRCSHHPVLVVYLLSILIISNAQQAVPEPPKKILVKVNLGGGPVADFLGEDQVLDMSGFSKNVVRVKVENTDNPDIFQSTRFSRGKDMTFRIPVPTGLYSLTLLFAETYQPACVPGARVFDISLGTPISGISKIVDKFDLFQSAGCLSAHGKRFDKVPSKDGIVVHFHHKSQNPSLCGFIVEGIPLPVGDGSEFKAIAIDASLIGSAQGQSFGAPVVATRRRLLSTASDVDYFDDGEMY